MENYILSWQDYGQERRRTVKYHLDRLKSLLLPTNVRQCIRAQDVVDKSIDNELEGGQGG